MKRWLGIKATDEGVRDTFLVNKRYTTTEVYRMRNLCDQLRLTEQKINALSARLRTVLGAGYDGLDGQKNSRLRTQVKLASELSAEVSYLLFTRQSLREMTEQNQVLRDRLAFEIAKAERVVVNALEQAASAIRNHGASSQVRLMDIFCSPLIQ